MTPLRVLFSATPAYGHLLPQLPLARALRERGNDVAVLSTGTFGPALAPEGIELLPAGPTMGELLAEAARRTGADPTQPDLGMVAELFGRVRIDFSADEALTAARRWQPDLVVSDMGDSVGPLVAAALDVPLATMAYGPAMPPEFTVALDAATADRYAERGLTRRPATWYLDICPPAMQWDNWQPPESRIGLRPEAHQHPWESPADTVSADRASTRDRPQVLVSFGTEFLEPEALSPLLRELSAGEADLVVTLGMAASAADFDVDHSRVTFVGFTPLNRLLQGIDLVLTHGGAGTTLGALAAGIPLVVIPQGADQFIQADRVASSNSGLALLPGEVTPEAVAKAVSTVLADPAYRTSARAIAAQIAALPSADDVAAQLETALAGTRRS
jgi:UDP:flavonoid glycosyltransferase YjiC (YdhE family)